MKQPNDIAPALASILRPFQRFASFQASGGIVLLACAAVAMAWANSPAAASYDALWQTPVTVAFAAFTISKPLLLWINDGLMAIFFFVVGLEIKREILVGELASARRAALPVVAALGGMIVPALLYLAFTAGTPAASGWGIPVATDIAFALGILALLGSRAPISLKVFLTALAIADDLGAVLVIALFYTAKLSLTSLALGLGLLLLLWGANRAGVRRPGIFLAVGVVIWVAFLKSGVHATIAGVLLALTIPARSGAAAGALVIRGRELLAELERSERGDVGSYSGEDRQALIAALEDHTELSGSPLWRLEHGLHPWVAFFIMPVFALANAGVAVGGGAVASLSHPVGLGVLVGLVLGKQVGVTLFSWLSVRLGLATLPADLTWGHIYGVSWLAGIGFTMSLFITGLAFTDPALVTVSKLGILAASAVAGLVGWSLLRLVAAARSPAANGEDGTAETAARDSAVGEGDGSGSAESYFTSSGPR
jgi:Na+:H+ antiporter, NhaA family